MVDPSSGEGAGASPGPEHALLSLRAHRHDDWQPFLARAGVPLLPLHEAVIRLAGQDLDPLQRLQVLHDLGALGKLEEMIEPASELAADVIHEQRLGDVVALAHRPEMSFADFVREVGEQGISRQALSVAAADTCSAAPSGTQPDAATTIVASFQAPGVPSDFAYGADPLHWPECNAFFIRMTPQPKSPLPAIDNVDGNAYRAVVNEVVGVPLVWEISTNLEVCYFVAANAVGMDFSLVGGDGQIDVDHGFVIVEPHRTQPNMVVVRSQKTVRFTRLPNFPALMVCDMGWTYVMRNMASCSPPN